jgi:hypothetical protein
MKTAAFLMVLILLPAGLLIPEDKVDLAPAIAPALFGSHNLLEIKLNYDITATKKDIKGKSSYRAAQFTFKASDNKEYSFPVKLKTRGHFRKNPRVCDSPPLLIRFTQTTTQGTLFAKQKKLKLVTHCKKNIKIFNHYVIKEYLIYRIYNILTPWSFQARLVRVTYTDSKRKAKPVTRFGILLENEHKMAKRLKGKVIHNRWGYHVLTKVPTHNRLLHAVFQFMIGHTDWSVPGEHNLKLVETKDKQHIFPVPYDFDLTGFVNAHYAQPDPKFKAMINSIRDRLYRGFYMPIDSFTPVFATFKEKKELIYALLTNHPYLKATLKNRAIKYLDTFYKILDNPRQIKKHFIDTIRRKKK